MRILGKAKGSLILFSCLFTLGLAGKAETVLVKGGTILTVTNGIIENGSILIEDGKIAAVGPDIQAPSGATIIDASGQYVMPGIIDAHSHLAIEGGVNEGTLAVTSMTRVEDVLNPDDIAIYRELAGGVTTTNVLHGSANPIGGTKTVIKLRWGKDAEGMIMQGAPPGIKMALGENVKRSGSSGSNRYPATRMGTMDVIRDAFVRAREYQKEWKRYEARKAAGETHLIPPRRDLELEPLVEVLEGRMLVHCHAYRADEILQMIRLAEEFGFKVNTMEHVLEGYKVADELAQHGTAALTFSDWWAYKMEAYDAIPYNAALLMERGVLVAIKSDSEEEARHLNQEAAKCIKWGGISEKQALELVTINPAIALGIDNRVGSIETGKDADLVIFNHHPFSVYAIPMKTIIDGVVYFDRDRDLTRRGEIAREKEALIEKLKPEENRSQDNRRPDAGNDRDPRSKGAQ